MTSMENMAWAALPHPKTHLPVSRQWLTQRSHSQSVTHTHTNDWTRTTIPSLAELYGWAAVYSYPNWQSNHHKPRPTLCLCHPHLLLLPNIECFIRVLMASQKSSALPFLVKYEHVSQRYGGFHPWLNLVKMSWRLRLLFVSRGQLSKSRDI